MKKVFEQILTWFENTFQDDETEDWYHKQIVDSVVARYTTKAKLKEELSDIIASLQQEQPEIKSHIENLLKECADNSGEYYRGHREALMHLFYYLGGDPSKYLHFIEQPRVDLSEHQIADIIQNLFPTDQFIESESLLLDREEAILFARHFFELGKARKEE